MDSGPESRSLQRRLKRGLNALPSRDGGLFLGSGLLLLVVLLIGVSREQHWGERSFLVNLRTPRADGLKPGMEVRLSGLPVGRVTEMSLQDDASVAIQLRIDERYRRLIGPRSLAYQNQDGLVGDSFIAITPHPQATPAAERRTGAEQDLSLPYQPSLDLRQVLLDLAQTRMDLTRTLQHTSQIAGRDLPLALSDLRQTLRQTNRLAGQDVPLALGDFRRTMDNVGQLSGTLDREAASTAPRLRQTLSEADRTGEGARLAAVQAQTRMRDSGPVLIRTLREIQTLTATTNRLLDLLLGSKLLGPEPPAQPPAGAQAPSRAPMSRP
jgi:phospholipid/cholesterol/gamma-HCH transport system substrate-binding protein